MDRVFQCIWPGNRPQNRPLTADEVLDAIDVTGELPVAVARVKDVCDCSACRYERGELYPRSEFE